MISEDKVTEENCLHEYRRRCDIKTAIYQVIYLYMYLQPYQDSCYHVTKMDAKKVLYNHFERECQ